MPKVRLFSPEFNGEILWDLFTKVSPILRTVQTLYSTIQAKELTFPDADKGQEFADIKMWHFEKLALNIG